MGQDIRVSIPMCQGYLTDTQCCDNKSAMFKCQSGHAFTSILGGL